MARRKDPLRIFSDIGPIVEFDLRPSSSEPDKSSRFSTPRILFPPSNKFYPRWRRCVRSCDDAIATQVGLWVGRTQSRKLFPLFLYFSLNSPYFVRSTHFTSQNWTKMTFEFIFSLLAHEKKKHVNFPRISVASATLSPMSLVNSGFDTFCAVCTPLLISKRFSGEKSWCLDNSPSDFNHGPFCFNQFKMKR